MQVAFRMLHAPLNNEWGTQSRSQREAHRGDNLRERLCQQLVAPSLQPLPQPLRDKLLSPASRTLLPPPFALPPQCWRELGRPLPCWLEVPISAKMPSRPVPDLALSASLWGGLILGPCLQAESYDMPGSKSGHAKQMLVTCSVAA